MRARGERAARALLAGPWGPVALYVTLVVVAGFVVTFTVDHLGLIDDPYPGLLVADRPWIAGWARWDAGWYLQIVADGYSYFPGEQSTVAFFPGYPLLVGLLWRTPLDLPSAAVVVTVVAGLAATILFTRWLRTLSPGRPPLPAVAALLLSPFAFFLLGAVYSDALFLAATLAAFLALERGRPGLAGLAGAVATLSRPVGPAVVLGLAWRAWERRDRPLAPIAGRPRQSRAWWLLVSIAALGFVGYSTYLGIRFNSPFAFVEQTSAPGWDQAAGPRTWFKIRFVEAMVEGTGIIRLRNLAHLSMVVGALAMVPLVRRRFGNAYAAFVLLMVLVPALSSRDFMGLGRYVLAAFPVFAAAGEVLERWPRGRFVVYGFGGISMLTGTVLFARGFYIS